MIIGARDIHEGKIMKRITAIIGSPVKTQSNTAALTEEFLKLVKSLDNTVEYEIIILGNKQINMCLGCWACTEKGYCIQKDDLNGIQEKLLSSDLIILGSPVYVHTVTAQMKAFADRIFVWYHICRLIGKPAITSVTTAKSGTRPTEKYLNMLLYLLGTVPVGHLRGTGYRPGELQNRDKIREQYRKLAEKTVRILNGRKKIRPGIMNHVYFTAMKMKAKYGKGQLSYEYGYWQDKGWFKKSFRQAAATDSV